MMAGSDGELQTAEVASLKEYYGKACRVIADVGDFTHIVAIQPLDLGLITIKFQLPGRFMLECGRCHIYSTMIVIRADEFYMISRICSKSNVHGVLIRLNHSGFYCIEYV